MRWLPQRFLPSRFVRAPRRSAIGLLLCLCVFGAAVGLRAQNAKPTQSDVEAAYLFQFGRFVQWPAQDPQQKPADFPICILGRDPFGKTLDDTIKGEDVNGTPLSARRIAFAPQAVGCRVLFVGTSAQKDLPNVIAALGAAPVLTVSDIPDFNARGGMIQFVVVEKKVRFRVNLSSTQKAGLTLSSQLLKVAVSVQGGGAAGAPPENAPENK